MPNNKEFSCIAKTGDFWYNGEMDIINAIASEVKKHIPEQEKMNALQVTNMALIVLSGYIKDKKIIVEDDALQQIKVRLENESYALDGVMWQQKTAEILRFQKILKELRASYEVKKADFVGHGYANGMALPEGYANTEKMTSSIFGNDNVLDDENTSSVITEATEQVTNATQEWNQARDAYNAQTELQRYTSDLDEKMEAALVKLNAAKHFLKVAIDGEYNAQSEQMHTKVSLSLDNFKKGIEQREDFRKEINDKVFSHLGDESIGIDLNDIFKRTKVQSEFDKNQAEIDKMNSSTGVPIQEIMDAGGAFIPNPSEDELRKALLAKEKGKEFLKTLNKKGGSEQQRMMGKVKQWYKLLQKTDVFITILEASKQKEEGNVVDGKIEKASEKNPAELYMEEMETKKKKELKIVLLGTPMSEFYFGKKFGVPGKTRAQRNKKIMELFGFEDGKSAPFTIAQLQAYAGTNADSSWGVDSEYRLLQKLGIWQDFESVENERLAYADYISQRDTQREESRVG